MGVAGGRWLPATGEINEGASEVGTREGGNFTKGFHA